VNAKSIVLTVNLFDLKKLVLNLVVFKKTYILNVFDHLTTCTNSASIDICTNTKLGNDVVSLETICLTNARLGYLVKFLHVKYVKSFRTFYQRKT
jgi:hypothetical protein